MDSPSSSDRVGRESSSLPTSTRSWPLLFHAVDVGEIWWSFL